MAWFAPSPALEGLVAFHYVLRAGDAPFDATLCALLGQVQAGLGGTAAFHLRGERQALPPLAVIGPTDRMMRMEAPPGYAGVGSALTPAGWHALVRAKSDLANRIEAAAAVFSDETALPQAADIDGMLAALDDFMLARLKNAPPPDPRIAVIDRWVIDDNGSGVDALAEVLSLSRRALERLTTRTHGAPPRRLAAKYRALMAAGRLAVGEVDDWRAAAMPGDFTDQSHFIREFRRYVGVTPGRFMADETLFVRLLVRGPWSVGKELGIAIWA